MVKRCDKCRYFYSYGKDANGMEEGECRRHAPTIIARTVRCDCEDFDVWGYWPKVRGGYWCGEYLVKEGKEGK